VLLNLLCGDRFLPGICAMADETQRLHKAFTQAIKSVHDDLVIMPSDKKLEVFQVHNGSTCWQRWN